MNDRMREFGRKGGKASAAKRQQAQEPLNWTEAVQREVDADPSGFAKRLVSTGAGTVKAIELLVRKAEAARGPELGEALEHLDRQIERASLGGMDAPEFGPPPLEPNGQLESGQNYRDGSTVAERFAQPSGYEPGVEFAPGETVAVAPLEIAQIRVVDGAAFVSAAGETVPAVWGAGGPVLWAEGEPLKLVGSKRGRESGHTRTRARDTSTANRLFTRDVRCAGRCVAVVAVAVIGLSLARPAP
jgi:hypothetical protein